MLRPVKSGVDARVVSAGVKRPRWNIPNEVSADSTAVTWYGPTRPNLCGHVTEQAVYPVPSTAIGRLQPDSRPFSVVTGPCNTRAGSPSCIPAGRRPSCYRSLVGGRSRWTVGRMAGFG